MNDTPSWNRFNRERVVHWLGDSEPHYRHQEVWVSEDKESPTYILVSRVKFEEWETMIFRCDSHGNVDDLAYGNPLYDHRGDWEPMVVSVRKMIQETTNE